MFSTFRSISLAVLLVLASTTASAEDLSVAKAGVGRGIDGKALVDEGSTFSVGDKVYALFLITNPGAPKTAKIVWKHGGTVRGSLDITIGTSKTGWKTYGQHKMSRKAVGSWTVDVEGEDGTSIASASFTVQ